jgi:hypothetical protein
LNEADWDRALGKAAGILDEVKKKEEEFINL